MSKSIGLFLRNTYAMLNHFGLRLTEPNLKSYSFIRGNDLPRYIKENNYKTSDYDVISIIDINISNIYWDNRELLNITDLENLTEYMKQSPLEFELSSDNISSNISIYKLSNNNIVDYNVLYITVKDFVNFINSNKPITIKLPKIDVNIEIQYEPYDFYNYLTSNIDNFIAR